MVGCPQSSMVGMHISFKTLLKIKQVCSGQSNWIQDKSLGFNCDSKLRRMRERGNGLIGPTSMLNEDDMIACEIYVYIFCFSAKSSMFLSPFGLVSSAVLSPCSEQPCALVQQ